MPSLLRKHTKRAAPNLQSTVASQAMPQCLGELVGTSPAALSVPLVGFRLAPDLICSDLYPKQPLPRPPVRKQCHQAANLALPTAPSDDLSNIFWCPCFNPTDGSTSQSVLSTPGSSGELYLSHLQTRQNPRPS